MIEQIILLVNEGFRLFVVAFFFKSRELDWEVLAYFYFELTLNISPSVPSHSHTLLLLFFSFSNLIIFAGPALWALSQVAQKDHYLCVIPLRTGHDAFHGLQVSFISAHTHACTTVFLATLGHQSFYSPYTFTGIRSFPWFPHRL